MAKKSNRNVDPLPLTPEEMKAIGEIELGPSRHEQFLNNHYKKLIVGTLIFMLCATAAIIYGTWRARQEADAAAAVIGAMKVPGGSAEVGDYDLAALESVSADYTGTKASTTAELLRGMQLISGGQEQQGISVLEQVIATAADPFLKLRAQAFLAGHYMSGGDAQKATALWKDVAGAGQSPWQALSLLTLGDLAKQAGDVELARSYYTQVQENCPASPLLVTVQQRLVLLGVDAPVPVAEEPKEEPQQPKEDALPGWSSPLNFSAGGEQ